MPQIPYSKPQVVGTTARQVNRQLKKDLLELGFERSGPNEFILYLDNKQEKYAFVKVLKSWRGDQEIIHFVLRDNSLDYISANGKSLVFDRNFEEFDEFKDFLLNGDF